MFQIACPNRDDGDSDHDAEEEIPRRQEQGKAMGCERGLIVTVRAESVAVRGKHEAHFGLDRRIQLGK